LSIPVVNSYSTVFGFGNEPCILLCVCMNPQKCFSIFLKKNHSIFLSYSVTCSYNVISCCNLYVCKSIISYELNNNTTILHVLHISEKMLCSVIVSIKKLKQYKFYENVLERKHRQAYTYVHHYIYVCIA